MPSARILPAFLAAGCDQFEGQEQGPFRLDALELHQFLGLVMQPADILRGGLMAIAEKALVAVVSAQFPADAENGAFA